MTLLQVEELATYWAQHPPTHLLVAAYLGVGKDGRPPTRRESAGLMQTSSSDADAMVAQLGPGFSAGDVHAGLSPVVLDFAELRRRSALD
jgi:hypothetical protein